MYVLALELASPWNQQHCANCIGTLSFPMPISVYDTIRYEMQF